MLARNPVERRAKTSADCVRLCIPRTLGNTPAEAEARLRATSSYFDQESFNDAKHDNDISTAKNP
jgi:hypothetical protein